MYYSQSELLGMARDVGYPVDVSRGTFEFLFLGAIHSRIGGAVNDRIRGPSELTVASCY